MTNEIETAELENVTGGGFGSFVKKAVKAIPGASAVTALASGYRASQSFARESRAGGQEPSVASQIGAGALNATSTFIDNSMLGVPGAIIDWHKSNGTIG